MSEGLGLGMNTLAGLVTRGCAEMTKLAIRMGARPETISGIVCSLSFASQSSCSDWPPCLPCAHSGLAGVGDLMLTCFGSLSRNRTVGKRLGSGESLQAILDSMDEVAEGKN